VTDPLSSNLVTRLRIGDPPPGQCDGCLMNEAADEIERLQRELAEMRDLMASAFGNGDEVVRRLRGALQKIKGKFRYPDERGIWGIVEKALAGDAT
jgi:hypothetical protein